MSEERAGSNDGASVNRHGRALQAERFKFFVLLFVVRGRGTELNEHLLHRKIIVVE